MTRDKAIDASGGQAKVYLIANWRAWGECPGLTAPFRDG